MTLRSICFVALCGVLAPASVAAAPAVRNVLILASRDSLQPAYEQFMAGFRPLLGAQGEVELFTEFLDSPRFPEPEHRQRTLRLLREKYAAKQIDLVVTTSPPAFNYLLEHRQHLFPAAPHVFALVSALELPARPLAGDVIGVLDRFDLVKTVELARALQPKAQRVAVVTGADAFDRMWEGIARRDLQPTLGGMEFTYLSGLPLPRLLEEVAGLPADSIVLYLSVLRDGDGQILRAPEVLQKLSAASVNPTYGLFPSYLGSGMVGGYLNSFEAVGEHTAAIVLRLLSGEKPEQVRAEPSGPEGRYLVDWRQLQRFGLSESNLPPGSLVRNRPPTLWEQHRALILVSVALILFQAGLIAALLLQRARRQKAESEAEHRRAELAQASRLALAGELSASIAHEINQPLGAILANAGAAEALLRRHPEVSEELREILADIRSADLRASEVIGSVRALVSARPARREQVDVNVMVREVLAFLRAEAERRGVKVDSALEPGLPVLQADRVQLQQALVNLCVNAMEAMAGSAGERRLDVRTRMAEDGIEIAVSDSGPGIPPENLGKIFDSFFTTKSEGTGLGLAMTRSIVEAHGGAIAAQNLKQGGARLRIVLRTGAPA